MAQARRPTPASGFGSRKPCGANEARYGAELVGREKARQGCGLNSERRLEFEQFTQFGLGRCIVRGQPEPVAKQSRVDRRFPGIRVTNRGMIEEVGKGEP